MYREGQPKINLIRPLTKPKHSHEICDNNVESDSSLDVLRPPTLLKHSPRVERWVKPETSKRNAEKEGNPRRPTETLRFPFFNLIRTRS